jgi:hypothetical protein
LIDKLDIIVGVKLRLPKKAKPERKRVYQIQSKFTIPEKPKQNNPIALSKTMSNPGEATRNPMGYSFHVSSNTDPRVPLLNLPTVCTRMDSLQQFLSESVNNNTLISKDQMDMDGVF